MIWLFWFEYERKYLNNFCWVQQITNLFINSPNQHTKRVPKYSNCFSIVTSKMSPKFVGNENIKSNSNTKDVNNHNGSGNDNDDDGIHIQNCLWTKTLELSRTYTHTWKCVKVYWTQFKCAVEVQISYYDEIITAAVIDR